MKKVVRISLNGVLYLFKKVPYIGLLYNGVVECCFEPIPRGVCESVGFIDDFHSLVVRSDSAAFCQAVVFIKLC